MVDPYKWWVYGRGDGLSPNPPEPMARFSAGGQLMNFSGAGGIFGDAFGGTLPPPPPVTSPTDQVSQATEYFHAARMTGQDDAASALALRSAGYSDSVINASLLGNMPASKPFYKRWQTYAIAGGVLAAGGVGYAIGKHRR